jgi:predicted nucleotidyltransferase
MKAMEMAALIIEKLLLALEHQESVDAMWLGGSKAFGRNDDLSDLDIVLQVEPAVIDRIFALCRTVLEEVSPVSVEYRLPEPTWHGMSQTFYQLRDAPEHLMIDLCIRPRGKTDGPQFNEIEIHGNPEILFDKCNCVNPMHIDMDEQRAKAQAQIPDLRSRYLLFRHLPRKEQARGHPVDALNFYNQMLLATLLRLLRIRHTPAQFDWGARYLKHQLPADVYARLEPLYFVRDMKDLAVKYQQCREWIEAELEWWSERNGEGGRH